MIKFQRFFGNYSRHFTWAVLLSEFSHVFCCVLPTIFTLITVAVNVGLIGAAVPFLPFLDTAHHFLHDYELSIIAFSGIMMVLGWLAFAASRKADCHNTGCSHPPCDPVKERNKKILTFATVLFVCNVAIYLVVHQNVFDLAQFHAPEIQHNHHDD